MAKQAATSPLVGTGNCLLLNRSSTSVVLAWPLSKQKTLSLLFSSLCSRPSATSSFSLRQLWKKPIIFLFLFLLDVHFNEFSSVVEMYCSQTYIHIQQHSLNNSVKKNYLTSLSSFTHMYVCSGSLMLSLSLLRVDCLVVIRYIHN